MKRKSSVIITIVIILMFVFSLSCMVVTGEDEYKLIRQFGKVDHIESEAGLSFKIPLT